METEMETAAGHQFEPVVEIREHATLKLPHPPGVCSKSVAGLLSLRNLAVTPDRVPVFYINSRRCLPFPFVNETSVTIQ